MNAELERDLDTWEAGELAHEELVSRHGQEAVAITAVRDSLVRSVEGPSLDADGSWAAFAVRLEQPATVTRLRGRRTRTAALAVAAAMMLAGSAIAVVAPRVVGGPEPIAPSITPPPGVGDRPPSGRDESDFVTPSLTPTGRSDDDPNTDTGGSEAPAEQPTEPAEVQQGDDGQGDDGQGDDGQGDDGQGDDGQGDDGQGDDGQGDDGQGDDGQGDDGQGDDGQGDDGQGDDGQGDDDQGDDGQGDDDQGDDQGSDTQGWGEPGRSGLLDGSACISAPSSDGKGDREGRTRREAGDATPTGLNRDGRATEEVEGGSPR